MSFRKTYPCCIILDFFFKIRHFCLIHLIRWNHGNKYLCGTVVITVGNLIRGSWKKNVNLVLVLRYLFLVSCFREKNSISYWLFLPKLHITLSYHSIGLLFHTEYLADFLHFCFGRNSLKTPAIKSHFTGVRTNWKQIHSCGRFWQKKHLFRIWKTMQFFRNSISRHYWHFFCNLKFWKLIANSCQPNEFEYKFRFVKGDWINITGRERLIRSHSSARFCFELSGNSN